MSGDQAVGVDPQFTVNVDGQQIGGPQTVSASHSAGQQQTFTFAGNYGPGHHDVTITYANNFIFPGVGGDRNLWIDNVKYDDTTLSAKSTPIYEGPYFPPNSTEGVRWGNSVYSVNDTTPIPGGAPSTPTTTPGAVSVGSGPDALVLEMSEDPFQGDASFTVSVDGKQIGGTQTTTAITNQGQQQEFDVFGNFGGGGHTVSINFTNDFIGGFYPPGTPGLPPGVQWALDTEDRNLYVISAKLNGGDGASGAPWELSGSGSHDFFVTAGSNPSARGSGPTSGATTSDNATITAGSLTAGQPTSGSSSGISFVAAPAAAPATAAPATANTATATPTPAPDPTPTPAAAPPADTTASVAAAATPTVADYTPPTPASSGGHTHHHWSGGAQSAWWADHHPAAAGGSTSDHHA